MKSLPILYIFSGLPASGKTTLAKRLAEYCGAVYLRIDTVEQGLRDICSLKVQGEGYRLAYRVAADNLILGNSVVADSCNPLYLTRKEWQETAKQSNAAFVNIEVLCSDREVHRQRVVTRKTSIPNLQLPSWQDVLAREYQPWQDDHIIIDTANREVASCFDELVAGLPI